MDLRQLFYDRPEEYKEMLDVFSYTPTTLDIPQRVNIKRDCCILAMRLMENVPEGVGLRNALQSLQQLRAEALNAIPKLKSDAPS